MVLVAELAVWVLSPGEQPPDPVPVSASRYFAPAELERAVDFRDGQRWLAIGGLAIEGALLLTLALDHPAPVRRRLERLAARPVLGAAAAGAGISLLTRVALLPTDLVAHERAVDVGISTQSLSSWLWDVVRSTAIGMLIAAGAAALLIALVRRSPRRWWIPGSAIVTGLAVVFVWIAPVLLAPVFNRFEALPENSRARAGLIALGERAGVEIGDVYRIDASRRVRSLNAYVDGIGSSKRVVLYDNLLREANRQELDSIVAHELGHVAHDDIRRGLLFVAIVSPLGLLFARELALALTRRSGADPATPAALPAYLFAIALAAFVLQIPGNQLSRSVEASADGFALQLTGDPAAQIAVQRRLARTNLSDPDPPALAQILFGTHPSTIDRIGSAIAFRRAD
jgi:STE24 endopeptidase